MPKRTIVLITVLGVLTLAPTALAVDGDKDDTVVNFGYDDQSQVFVWGMSPDDGLYDCTLANGPLTTTYGLSEDGLVYVDGLTSGSDVVTFPARPQDELAEGLIAAVGPAEYSGADGECGLSGGTVAGPNGQVNHGMFMKLFNSLWEGPGRGCVARHIAQSDLGKGDQQVQVPDAEDSEDLVDGATGTIDFESVLADCVHGRQTGVTGEEKADEKRAQKAERAEERAEKKAEREEAKANRDRGKPESAPGKGNRGDD